MLALSSEFGGQETFKKSIIGYVESKPALWHDIEAQRARLNEPIRLRILTYALEPRIGGLWHPYPEVERRLAALDGPERRSP